MNAAGWFEIIEDVATELEMEFRGNDTTFEVTVDRWNTVAFSVRRSTEGHLHATMLDEFSGEPSEFVSTSFLLRSTLDVVRFCQLVALAVSIRAQRK